MKNLAKRVCVLVGIKFANSLKKSPFYGTSCSKQHLLKQYKNWDLPESIIQK